LANITTPQAELNQGHVHAWIALRLELPGDRQRLRVPVVVAQAVASAGDQGGPAVK
jgi:hypothetical protein